MAPYVEPAGPMSAAPPTLETERLTLRPLTLADYPAFAAFLGSQRAALMGGPFDARGAWGVFCHEVALWDLCGHGGLAVDLRSSGECVGVVEINAGPLFPEREIGWQVYQAHEGRGYATEAARALLHWAFGPRGLTTLVSYVDPANSRSAAVARRLGGVLDPSAPKQDPDDWVFRYAA